MTIEVVENPATGETITLAKGVVEQISIKELDEPDRFQNTHRAGVKIGNDWINNISLKVKEGNSAQIRFNNGTQAKPDWQTLEVGDEVRIVVQENEYNGKTYYNSGVSKIKLVKKGSGKASSGGGQTASSGGFKRDNTGVEIGHAVNGGFNLVRNTGSDPEEVVVFAKQVHDLTAALKKEYAEKNPDMSEYDVGASVGNAVLNATRDSVDIDDVEEKARWVLDTVVPAVAEYVRGGKKPAAPKKSAPAKSSARRTATKKQEEDQEVVADPQFSDPALDDDTPF